MPDRDEFFVGYLPTPPHLKRWLRACLAVSLVILGTLAGLLAARQRDPGDGVWDTEHEQTLEGTLLERPYHMLVIERAGAEPKMVLLVSSGKFGASNRVAQLHGQHVHARGFILQRGQRLLLELSDDPNAIRTDGQGTSIPIVPASQTINLRGEIVDPKCYAGAMKPGNGKTHNACAALCLRGGIPPMFLTDSTAYLLLDSDGGPLTGERLESAISLAGDSSTIQGQATQIGDFPALLVRSIARP